MHILVIHTLLKKLLQLNVIAHTTTATPITFKKDLEETYRLL